MEIKSTILRVLAIGLLTVAFAFAAGNSDLFSIHELEMKLTQSHQLNKGNLNFNVEVIPNVTNINVSENDLPQNETAMAINPNSAEVHAARAKYQALKGRQCRRRAGISERWSRMSDELPVSL